MSTPSKIFQFSSKKSIRFSFLDIACNDDLVKATTNHGGALEALLLSDFVIVRERANLDAHPASGHWAPFVYSSWIAESISSGEIVPIYQHLVLPLTPGKSNGRLLLQLDPAARDRAELMKILKRDLGPSRYSILNTKFPHKSATQWQTLYESSKLQIDRDIITFQQEIKTRRKERIELLFLEALPAGFGMDVDMRSMSNEETVQETMGEDEESTEEDSDSSTGDSDSSSVAQGGRMRPRHEEDSAPRPPGCVIIGNRFTEDEFHALFAYLVKNGIDKPTLEDFRAFVQYWDRQQARHSPDSWQRKWRRANLSEKMNRWKKAYANVFSANRHGPSQSASLQPPLLPAAGSTNASVLPPPKFRYTEQELTSLIEFFADRNIVSPGPEDFRAFLDVFERGAKRHSFDAWRAKFQRDGMANAVVARIKARENGRASTNHRSASSPLFSSPAPSGPTTDDFFDVASDAPDQSHSSEPGRRGTYTDQEISDLVDFLVERKVSTPVTKDFKAYLAVFDPDEKKHSAASWQSKWKRSNLSDTVSARIRARNGTSHEPTGSVERRATPPPPPGPPPPLPPLPPTPLEVLQNEYSKLRAEADGGHMVWAQEGDEEGLLPPGWHRYENADGSFFYLNAMGSGYRRTRPSYSE